MYVEAICPLCFASHIVPADMRGEKYRCEECEEVFVVNKKAKVTSKKPPKPRQVQPVDETEEPAQPAETASGAKLVEQPLKKKKADDGDEVLEIPDDAVQSGAPVVKKTASTKRRRDEDDEDRPKTRRRREDDDEDEGRRRKRPAARRSGMPVGLIVGLSAGGVILIGLIAIVGWLVARQDAKPQQQAQAPVQPLNNPAPQKMGPVEPPKEAPPVNPPPVNPPPVNPPPVNPPPVVPPNVEPPKPVVWNFKPDPAAAVVKLPANVKDEIKVPGATPQLIFPTRPSPFVAIGGNFLPNDERQVWNLEKGVMTGKVVGQVLTFGGSQPVLSPDGAHMAYPSHNKPGTVDVWALGPGKVTNIDLGGGLLPDLLDFAGPGRLVSGRHEGTQKLIVRVYDVATGKEERQFDATLPAAGAFVRDSLAISPGGGYLAVAANDHALRVYDLKTGAVVGDRALPLAGPRRLACRGLSFSPDGSELAGLFFASAGQSHLICWDAAKGDVVSDTALVQFRPTNVTLPVYKGHVLDWVGDRRGWLLYGYTLLDRKTSQLTPLAQPPLVGSPVPRHMVGPDHVVTFKTVNPPDKPNEQALTVSRFDPDRP